ncbi:MAG: hypothetical protein UW15_C0035G0001, partial [Parcubacteria group bacterium GW2011_GWC1_44_10]
KGVGNFTAPFLILLKFYRLEMANTTGPAVGHFG